MRFERKDLLCEVFHKLRILEVRFEGGVVGAVRMGELGVLEYKREEGEDFKEEDEEDG